MNHCKIKFNTIWKRLKQSFLIFVDAVKSHFIFKSHSSANIKVKFNLG